jgi:membrane protein YdbS with pleckstrin-like domain
VTDPSHTRSGIPDEEDPAAGRTTTPEHALEHAPGADAADAPDAATPKPEPEQRQTSEPPPASEATDTSSSVVDDAQATSVEPAVMTPPAALAALGFPEGEPQSLHPAHLRTQLIGHWITICVMSFGAFTILSSLTLAGKVHGLRLAVVPGLAAAAIGLIAWWGWRYQHLEHARTSFVISLAGCEIRRGVVWRRIITVPLSRIQHTDVTQGPLQRAYGLATLTLYTAGTEHAKVDLNGLAFDTAMNIRQYLFERSEAHE